MKVGVLAVVLAAVPQPCFALKAGVTNEASSPLPKIVHQLAPANQKVWPEAWFLCQERWKSLYGDWKYMLWNDEDVDNLVKTQYPKEYGWFKSAPMKILRVDAARAFILDAYGGIYADMDFFPYRRLELPEDGKALLVESGAVQEVVQNSFMASAKGHPFWKLCFQMMSSYIKEHPTKPANPQEEAHYVLNATGPWMLGRALKAGGAAMVEPLDKHRYNPDHDEAARCTETTCFMRHISTGCWGVNNVKCNGWSRDLSKEKKLAAAARTTKKVKPALLGKEATLVEAVKASEEEAQDEDIELPVVTDAFVDEFVTKLEKEWDDSHPSKHRISLLETGSTNGPARIFQQIVGPQLSLWARYLEAAESLQ